MRRRNRSLFVVIIILLCTFLPLGINLLHKVDDKSDISFEENDTDIVRDEDEQIDWRLILVNASHKIPENYEITLLTLSNGRKIDERIYPDLQEMFDDARAEGETSYTLSKLIKLAFDTIITNSTKPLIIAVIVGFILSSVSFLMAVYNVIAYFFDMAIVRGYTTTIFSIWFATGMILSMLGILGLYIGKIFDQVKQRPIYIVMETVNVDSE